MMLIRRLWQMLPHCSLLTRWQDSAAAAVADADLVIMAVPVGAVGAVAKTIVPHMKPGAVLTDTGSTKRSVLRDVAPHLNETIIWLPSHPLAGTNILGRRLASRICLMAAIGLCCH